jgi:hypothetical protein
VALEKILVKDEEEMIYLTPHTTVTDRMELASFVDHVDSIRIHGHMGRTSFCLRIYISKGHRQRREEVRHTQALNSVKLFALRTLLILFFVALKWANLALKSLVIQCVLFGVICPIGPIVKMRFANGPSLIHPPPVPPNIGISNPGISLVSCVSASWLSPPGSNIALLFT